MNSFFYHCPDLETFKTLQLATDDTNTEYFTYNSNTIIFGEPDVKWNQICFVSDDESPLIYTKGKIFYNLNDLKELIEDNFTDVAFFDNDDNDNDNSYSTTFDPETDTVWNKTQTLTSAQKAQVKTNLGIEDIVFNTNYDPTNNKATTMSDISGKENSSNKVTSITSSSTDIQYPSAKAVYSYIGGAGFLTSHQSLSGYATETWVSNKLDDILGIDASGISDLISILSDNDTATGILNTMSNKENSSNKVTSITNSSSDIEYPSAKAVYSYIGGAGFITSHQDISGKEDVVSIESFSGNTLTALVGKYYILTNIGTLSITLPTITSDTTLKMIAFYISTGSTPNMTFTSTHNIYYSEGFEIVASSTYEVNAAYNGIAWIITSIKIIIPNS